MQPLNKGLKNIDIVDTLSYKTLSVNKETANKQWFVVDAEGQTLGRMASKVDKILRGKLKTNFTPHADCGDFVIILTEIGYFGVAIRKPAN